MIVKRNRCRSILYSGAAGRSALLHRSRSLSEHTTIPKGYRHTKERGFTTAHKLAPRSHASLKNNSMQTLRETGLRTNTLGFAR